MRGMLSRVVSQRDPEVRKVPPAALALSAAAYIGITLAVWAFAAIPCGLHLNAPSGTSCDQSRVEIPLAVGLFSIPLIAVAAIVTMRTQRWMPLFGVAVTVFAINAVAVFIVWPAALQFD